MPRRQERQHVRILRLAVLFGLYAGLVALVADVASWLSDSRPRGVSFGISMWYAYLMLCGLGAVTLFVFAKLRLAHSLGLTVALGGAIVALTFPGLDRSTSAYHAMLAGAFALNCAYLIIKTRIRDGRPG